LIIILVKAGSPVDQTIAALSSHMDPDDTIIDRGNENTERLSDVCMKERAREERDRFFSSKKKKKKKKVIGKLQ